MRLLTALLATSLIAAPALASPDVIPAVEGDPAAHLEKLFVDFHRNPELSFMETRTAAVMAKELRAIGSIEVTEEVTEKVGGTGVVGVIRNRRRAGIADARRPGRPAAQGG